MSQPGHRPAPQRMRPRARARLAALGVAAAAVPALLLGTVGTAHADVPTPYGTSVHTAAICDSALRQVELQVAPVPGTTVAILHGRNVATGIELVTPPLPMTTSVGDGYSGFSNYRLASFPPGVYQLYVELVWQDGRGGFISRGEWIAEYWRLGAFGNDPQTSCDLSGRW